MPSRSLRALLRLAALWAIPWALVGVALAVVAWRTQPVATPPLVPLPLTIWLGMVVPAITALGLISGLSAGLLLAWAERGRVVATLSPRRAMGWGVIGGVLPLLLLGAYGVVTGLPTANLGSIALAGTLTALGSGGLTGWLITTAQRRALPTPREATPLRLTALALLLGALATLTTPGDARAQTKPNAHPWFQPMEGAAKTTPSEVLSHYLSVRSAYTGRKPHVASCTRATPIEIPPMVLRELVRGGWGADSIWIDPAGPVGETEREAIAGAKGPYELVRITTFVIGWEASFIETIVEPADSPGGYYHLAYREHHGNRSTVSRLFVPMGRAARFLDVEAYVR